MKKKKKKKTLRRGLIVNRSSRGSEPSFRFVLEANRKKNVRGGESLSARTKDRFPPGCFRSFPSLPPPFFSLLSPRFFNFRSRYARPVSPFYFLPLVPPLRHSSFLRFSLRSFLIRLLLTASDSTSTREEIKKKWKKNKKRNTLCAPLRTLSLSLLFTRSIDPLSLYEFSIVF